MKCPRCNRELESGLKQCSYCGARIKRSPLRRLLDRLNVPKVDEGKFAQSMATGQPPRIASAEELRLYLKHSIGDEEFASLLIQILQKIGGGGAIQIKRGGDGNPYSVEYTYLEPPQHMSRSEIAERIEELRWALSQAKSPIEQERLEEELAQLAGTSATIWVNSSSRQDLDKANQLLQEAMEALNKLSG